MYSVWILIYVSMYLYSYPSTHGISGLAVGGAWEQFEVRLKMTIEWSPRCTWRLWSREFGDAIGDRDWVNSEMHWEAVIERLWRPRLSELRDALGGRDRASLEMHWEVMIERVWRCTGRPRSSELRDALGGRDRSSLEMHWEAVIERVWRCTCSRLWSSEIGGVLGGGRSGGGRSGGGRSGGGRWEARQVLRLYSSVS